MTFRPNIGLNGFMVQSLFDIEKITCLDLGSAINQLGIILYPHETLNEEFMKKIRDCVLKLPESHPVKIWMKWVASPKIEKKETQEQLKFLTEIINSKFNLITDLSVKNQIIETMNVIPEKSLPEKILKSFLYLMIGNVSRSDTIIREIITTPPVVNWEKNGLRSGPFHKLGIELSEQMFTKLKSHPADRKLINLLAVYLRSYYNDESLMSLISSIDIEELEKKIDLKYIKSISPQLVSFFQFKKLSKNQKLSEIRNLDKYELKDQGYWFWLFINLDPHVSDFMIPELKRLEKEDQLWFIYLMDNEKLFDFFAKKTKSVSILRRRDFIQGGLEDPESFMLSLFKLIQLGDVNSILVNKTINQLLHE